jgi:hypothetical protein
MMTPPQSRAPSLPTHLARLCSSRLRFHHQPWQMPAGDRRRRSVRPKLYALPAKARYDAGTPFTQLCAAWVRWLEPQPE